MSRIPFHHGTAVWQSPIASKYCCVAIDTFKLTILLDGLQSSVWLLEVLYLSPFYGASCAAFAVEKTSSVAVFVAADQDLTRNINTSIPFHPRPTKITNMFLMHRQCMQTTILTTIHMATMHIHRPPRSKGKCMRTAYQRCLPGKLHQLER
jgi:hypothetical protein